MSPAQRLFCPHCGNAILLKFYDYTSLRPGQLHCPACRRLLQFPLGVRLTAVFAGLVIGGFATLLVVRSAFWNGSTVPEMALKVVAFLFLLWLMMSVWAYVCRALVTRLEKDAWDRRGDA